MHRKIQGHGHAVTARWCRRTSRQVCDVSVAGVYGSHFQIFDRKRGASGEGRGEDVGQRIGRKYSSNTCRQCDTLILPFIVVHQSSPVANGKTTIEQEESTSTYATLTQLTQPGIDRFSANTAAPFKRQRVLCLVVSKRADLRFMPVDGATAIDGVDQYVSRRVVAALHYFNRGGGIDILGPDVLVGACQYLLMRTN